MTQKKIKRSKNHHPLSDLVGKKIKSIVLEEVKVSDTITCQFYRITCSDLHEVVLACSGGNEEAQHATAELWDPSDYEIFLQELTENTEEDLEKEEEEDTDPDEDEDFNPLDFEDRSSEL